MSILNSTDKIICIGDSLTFGYGIPKNKGRVHLLKEDLNLNIINKGINGDTSTGILSRFFKDVLTANSKICIIMCGTNDILYNREINFIIDNLNIMLKDCTSNNIIPILLSPSKTFKLLAEKLWDEYVNYIDINYKLDLFDKKLKKLCKNNNILFISLYDLIEQNKIYYTDGIHLSQLANSLIFRALKEKLLNMQ